MKQLLLILMLATPLAWSSVARADFFAGIDRSISQSRAGGQGLMYERYYRLMTRLSVYALYCDYQNAGGTSTLVSQQFRQMNGLNAEATRYFGGDRTAYNKFEAYRNEESARMSSVPNRPKTCRKAAKSFNKFIRFSESQLRSFLSGARYGSI